MTARFALRHAGGTVMLLGLLTLVIHALAVLAPGDAARTVAAGRSGGAPSAEQVASVRHELGLDRPQHEQYLDWLSGALTGDLGISLHASLDIGDLMAERVPTTVALALGAGGLAVVLGLAMGLCAALHHAGPARGAVRLAAVVLASIPPFTLAYLLVAVFALGLDLVPTSGRGGPATWVLPGVVLALPVAAVLSRLVAVSVRESMAADHALAARARGSGRAGVLLRDALPVAAGPLLAVSGVLLGALFGGTLIVEEVFGWPGVGSLFVDAVSARDTPVLQAAGLFFGAAFILANRTADLLHALVDPRVTQPVGAQPS